MYAKGSSERTEEQDGLASGVWMEFCSCGYHRFARAHTAQQNRRVRANGNVRHWHTNGTTSSLVEWALQKPLTH